MFFKTIVLREKELRAIELSNIWMGNNLTHKGLNDTLGKIGKKKEIEGPTQEEVRHDWMRLARTLQGA